MATRQYVGARYVIKIYENSVDPSTAEWESDVNYEPLTMVTYNYGSYLSKKAVPGTVGDPAANPDYWVQTGFYNGQIASLQSQIDTINNTTIPAIQASIGNVSSDITTLDTVVNVISRFANKKICIYGDSLSAHAFGNGDWTDPFGTIMTSLGATITNHAQAGGDMTDANNDANTDTNTYDFVIIWCGINDVNNATPLGIFDTPGNFSYLYSELINKIRVHSPNAVIYDFGLHYTNYNGMAFSAAKSLYFYNESLESVSHLKGVTFKSMLGLPNNSFADNSATVDGLHFTPAYSQDVIFHKILHDICNNDIVSNPPIHLRLDTGAITYNEPSSISTVTFEGFINTDGMIVIKWLFDVTTNLTADKIATLTLGAIPDRTQYCYLNGELFGFNQSREIIASRYLPTGRYYCEFIYTPINVMQFFVQ